MEWMWIEVMYREAVFDIFQCILFSCCTLRWFLLQIFVAAFLCTLVNIHDCYLGKILLMIIIVTGRLVVPI